MKIITGSSSGKRTREFQVDSVINAQKVLF